MSWRAFRSVRRLETRKADGDETAKDAIALTPQSRLFRVPNGLTASMYFTLMLFLCATGLADRDRVRRATVALSWLSLGVSGYLVYQLLFVLKRNCPICMRAHILNLALTSAISVRAVPEGRQPW